MARLNSVIRRYTPPTCTIEILAQSSPLSRWMGQTVIKQLRFNLHFDDPRLPQAERIMIKGDRDQLEELNHAVIFYVQRLLQESAENFAVSFSQQVKTDANLDKLETKDISPTASATTRLSEVSSDTPLQIPTNKIYLEPSGNLTHKLYLGSLSNQISTPVVQLSVLQLFDLATALDEYSSDVLTLPSFNSELAGSRLPNWASVAAILVFAAGLTPLTWQYANNMRQKQIRTAKKATPEVAKVATLPSPPMFSLNSPQPGFSPTNGVNSLSTSSSTNSPPAANVFPSDIFANSTPQTSPKNKLALSQSPSSSVNSSLNKNLQMPLKISADNIRRNSLDITTHQNILTKNYDTSRITPVIPSRFSNQTTIIPPVASPADPRLVDRNINKNSLGNQFSAKRRISAATEVATDSTLFDTPQVAEAREYLKRRWQPPSGLSQTLEYSLMLGVDGSLERLLPLNQAAREYVDSSGIPEIGKAFVSANKSGKNMRLRVVLSPDGRVQTFPESP